MTDPSTSTKEPSTTDAADPPAGLEQDGEAMVESELLVEEISIDGMCGVY